MKRYFVCIVAMLSFVSCSDGPDTPPDTHSPYISRVFEFMPAPGQFVNSIPEWKEGMGREDMLRLCEDYLVGQRNGGTVSLGGFGGYMVFGFDHTVENKAGLCDLRIMGNAYNAGTGVSASGSSEPGVVMVSRDVNANGLPDDMWYEIAGSEYDNPATVHDYRITYYRPATEVGDADAEGTCAIKQYIRWNDNQGGAGYISKNIYHSQTYFPQWVDGDSIMFAGTLLPPNAVDNSGDGSYWVLFPYDYGYADNAPNNDDGSAIDISWAVDATGHSVSLEGIDFVKVYSAVSQLPGWLGETSTEVCGACDLHLAKETVASR